MKRVLVSGGSRGIGAETVKRFCSMGYSVAFIYQNSDEAAKSLEKEYGAFPIKADMSDENSVVSAVSKAAKYLGDIDILVSNAGVSFVGQICDTNGENWRRVVDTNLSGAFYLTREVSKYMVRQHYGRIITVGSVWGKCGASCEVAYSASKSGIRGLTMALAKELGPSGITVNCVEPGIIDTDMNKCFSDQEITDVVSEIPAGRIGKTSDVSSLIVFLSSDGASYINGQCIAVDGGWCI